MFITLVVAFVVASGCSDSEAIPLGGISPSVLNAAGAANVSGTLYVANPLSSAVLRFRAADTGNDISPQAILSGGSTRLNRPTQLVADTSRNLLYVLDDARVLVFASASSTGGNVAPVHVILPSTPGAQAIAVDTASDVLYLGHSASGGITSYDGASALDGQVGPARVLAGASTGLVSPFGLAIGAANRLVFTDMTSNLLATYDGASARSGDIAPDRALAGVAAQLVDPFGVCVDGTGALIVGDIASLALSVFPAAATGNVGPSARVGSASTLLTDPRQLACADGATVYVADGASGFIKCYQANDLRAGHGAPVRAFSATSAGMSIPTGIAHDPTR